MKISELDENQIKPGLRIQSLKDYSGGTIVLTDHLDRYPYSWILWDKDLFDPISLIDGEKTSVYSGFFENQCECLILEDQNVPMLVQQFIDNYPKCKDCLK